MFAAKNFGTTPQQKLTKKRKESLHFHVFLFDGDEASRVLYLSLVISFLVSASIKPEERTRARHDR